MCSAERTRQIVDRFHFAFLDASTPSILLAQYVHASYVFNASFVVVVINRWWPITAPPFMKADIPSYRIYIFILLSRTVYSVQYTWEEISVYRFGHILSVCSCSGIRYLLEQIMHMHLFCRIWWTDMLQDVFVCTFSSAAAVGHRVKLAKAQNFPIPRCSAQTVFSFTYQR